jgi:hypothetical protein
MILTRKSCTSLRVILLFLGITSFTFAAVNGRLGISQNNRYFTDGNGEPLFWLASTQWVIHREYSTAEARRTLENIASKDFTIVATMLVGWGDGTTPNLDGERPWLNNDPSTPNEAYFTNVDSVVQIAAEYGLYVRLGILHNAQLQYMSDGKGRAYAIWIAERYKDAPNVFYSIHGNVSDPDIIAMVREMAAAIEETAGADILISQKPDPAPNSSGRIQEESWLDYTQSQTWNAIDQIYPMVTQDYSRTPIKPTVMDEGAYEEGSEYGFEVTPLLVRRQAYYTYLAGGHHTYGHNDSWRVLPTWEEALDAPGAFQMGILKKIFTDRYEWWNLIPDQSLFIGGGQTQGTVLQLAARHEDSLWAIFYLAEATDFTVQMDKLGASDELNAFWINPGTGDSLTIGSLIPEGEESFSVPDNWEDAILVLETESASTHVRREIPEAEQNPVASFLCGIQWEGNGYRRPLFSNNVNSSLFDIKGKKWTGE